MTDVMQGLVQEAKKNKFSSIGPVLSDEDVVSVWDGVSAFIEKQMALQKGVTVPGLGSFTFSQKKLDVGNNKFILIQRPVFLLSEKFAQTHGLHYTKHHVTGQIPVVQLNYSALSFETPFDRDTVESCVKEVLLALARSVGAKRNVEFTFTGIGRLAIRDSKVKMKFYKEFINGMDGSGQLLNALKDRPGTVDSVMSARTPTRCHTSNTLILPRITHGNGGLGLDNSNTLPPITEDEAQEPTGYPEGGDQPAFEDTPKVDQPVELMPAALSEETDKLLRDIDTVLLDSQGGKKPPPPQEPLTSRSGSRMAVPLAKATGVNFMEDLMPGNGTPPLRRSLSPLNATSPPALPEGYEHVRAKSMDTIGLHRTGLSKIPAPPLAEKPASAGACGHANAGQELCYLCHQRARRNIPVSFTEERRRREEQEDKLLQQYQHTKDTEAVLEEQEGSLAKRRDQQKIAAFNLGVSEAVKTKKVSRSTDFHPSYIFQRRPLTPPRYIKQEEMHKDLEVQVVEKDDTTKKRRADEEFLGRLEQVQLAEDLAAQREQYLHDKMDQQDMYKRALSAQLRFKPLPIPERVSDSSEPVFGKNDMTNEKMFEKRKRAHELYQEQLVTVEHRKRDAILQRLQDQKDEEAMLKRNKKDLLEDRAERYQRLVNNRLHLEDDWGTAVHTKHGRERDEKQRARSPGMLLHEQCDQYNRCGQCKRRTHNCGESNIWRESRYIPGSRLMV